MQRRCWERAEPLRSAPYVPGCDSLAPGHLPEACAWEKGYLIATSFVYQFTRGWINPCSVSPSCPSPIPSLAARMM